MRSPYFVLLPLWGAVAVMVVTHWYETRSTPEQRQVDRLARRDRRRHGR